MGNHHNKSFFGTDSAILFDSGQLSSPAIFLTSIKKKEGGSWEKPSQKEGRAIKFCYNYSKNIFKQILKCP